MRNYKLCELVKLLLLKQLSVLGVMESPIGRVYNNNTNIRQNKTLFQNKSNIFKIADLQPISVQSAKSANKKIT